MSAGILCFGTVTVDQGKVIDHYPAREHLALISDVSKSTGGPGLNLAIDLRRLDKDLIIQIVGAVGGDANADYLLGECDKYRIDTSDMQKFPGISTPFTDCMVEKHGGKRTFFFHSGSGDLLDSEKVDLDKHDVKVLHVGAAGVHKLMDQDFNGETRWVRFLRQARERGIHTNMEMVSLAPDILKKLVLPCLPYLDSVIINEVEAGMLTDIKYEKADNVPPLDWEKLEQMALGLIKLGVKKFAVIHTPLGVVAVDKDGNVFRQGSVAVPDEVVISTTGAGDAVTAGVMYGVFHDWDLAKSIKAGVACAAMCIMDAHTSEGIKPINETLAAAESMGFRPTH